MNKFIFGLVFFICLSCGNKENVLLAKSDRTVVKDIRDLSPIYIFFRVNGKDTLAEVNRKNSIITTNWILNIDKRLPLRLVIPEVIKLQLKKREEKEHRNELALNYYSYADSIGKNLAFIPFTEVYYKLEKPKLGLNIYFNKNNTIQVNETVLERKDLQEYINKLPKEITKEIHFSFSKDLSYESYIQNEVFIESIKLTPNFKLKRNEFVY